MLTLPTTLRLTAAQFAEVCAANPEAVLELDADGRPDRDDSCRR